MTRIPITQIVLEELKRLRKKRIVKLIEDDPTIGEDRNVDHNNIENLMAVNYCLKTIEVIIILSSLSYFTGIIWMIFCDLTSYLVNDKEELYDPDHPATFFIGYDFLE